jgi:Transglycosylase SLT domain
MAQLSYAEIKNLIAFNNRSCYVDRILIAQIWKESRFDPARKATTSTATGLMMVTSTAVTETNRVKGTTFKHTDIGVASTNIQCGSLYLLICQERKGTLLAALNYYGTGTGYGDNIIAASDALIPEPADPIAVLQKYIGK